ncbi:MULTISPECIES: type II toxin-antitoxin system HipA family toxin [Cupriavidus]
MTSEVWVWAWLPGDTTPTLAGRFRHVRIPGGSTQQYRGQFVYGRSYLSNPDALALDPVQLRLVDRTYETTKLEGIFGPLRDAMPDDWGRHVIDRLYGPQPELTGYLLHGAGDHIGNLGFSSAQDQLPKTPSLPDWDSLATTRAMMQELEAGRPVDSALQAIFDVNTNMGGARPKITVQHQGKQWIAKFPALADKGAPIARIERAMLVLANACGIRSANAQVIDRDILLVERFDRAPSADGNGWRRDAFLSAQTVFYSNAAVQEYAFSGSYPRLAQELSRFSEAATADREQLYRRMVFNCCISNTDDHERNHGFLAGDTPGWYTLSPAYDMVPRRHNTRRKQHALMIGEYGYEATRENILSGHAAFGLSRARALDILGEIEATVQARWREVLLDEGLSEAQTAEWAGCFDLLPDALA